MADQATRFESSEAAMEVRRCLENVMSHGYPVAWVDQYVMP